MLDVRVVGIDFGTSNSTIGYPSESVSQLIQIEDGSFNIPSAIFYNLETSPTVIVKPAMPDAVHKTDKKAKANKLKSKDKFVEKNQQLILIKKEKYKIQFGREAISSYTDHYDGRLLRSLKSILGSSLIDDSTQIGYEQLSFKDIIGHFIKHLKNKAEECLGYTVEFVVMGRPVHFVDGDLEKDRLAQNQLESIVLNCGFKSVFFQYEPIAAALDYEQKITQEEIALVIDIGGGTSDFSVVRVSPSHRLKLDRDADVLANTGIHIGGTDLDRKLSIGQFMHHLGYKTKQKLKPDIELPISFYYDLATWSKIAFLYDKKTKFLLRDLKSMAAKPELIDRLIKIIDERYGHKLAGDIEAGKILLSEVDVTELNMNYIEKGLTAALSRKEFEENISQEREKIISCINECLKQAGILPEEVNTLFLTGGTTAVPSILNACRSVIPAARLVEGDRFGSVGTGLAIHAGILSESIHYLI